MHIESGDFETTYNKMYELRKPWTPENPGRIVAFMPGKVEEIKVKKGQKVEEGEIMMVFRAMKMNNEMLAPISGKVVEIHAETGVNVPKNTVLMVIK